MPHGCCSKQVCRVQELTAQTNGTDYTVTLWGIDDGKYRQRRLSRRIKNQRGLFEIAPPTSAAFSLTARRRSVAAPFPFQDLRQILTVGSDVLLMFDALVADGLLGISRGRAQPHPFDHVRREMESIHIVEEHHVERRRSGAFFFVPADVKVLVIGPAIREAMDQPGIAVIRENDGLIGRKEGVKVLIRQPVWVLGLILELHQVHNIDHPNFQLGHVLAEQLYRRERL